MPMSRTALLVAACACLLVPAVDVRAAVTVVTGPTPIPRGDATGENDITVSNGIFAVAFAVDTAPPWGVARGGIVDIAILDNGEPPHSWGSARWLRERLGGHRVRRL